jgi:AcrR family transcriptional regulator
MADTLNSNETKDFSTKVVKSENEPPGGTPKSNDDKTLRNDAEARLLDTAEKLFAENGYDATSIRDITNNAKCNVAAVNYHFRNKQNLYNEVFHRRMTVMRDVRLAAIDNVMSQTPRQPTLTELIHAFSTAFLEPLLNKTTGRMFLKLIVREMNDPRLPKDMFVKEIVTPTLTALGKALTEICPHLDQKQITLSIISIVGQLIHVIRIREMMETGQFVSLPELGLPEIIDHIVEFSTSGIQAMAQGQSK